MKLIIATLFIVAALLLAGCASSGGQNANNGASAPANAVVSAPAAPSNAGSGGAAGSVASAPSSAGSAADVQTITVTAENFKFIPGTDTPITVKRGVPVKLLITSKDVAHGISIPALGINQDLPVGQQMEVDFTPDKAGAFPFRCSVFCGEGHPAMTGTIVVTD